MRDPEGRPADANDATPAPDSAPAPDGAPAPGGERAPGAMPTAQDPAWPAVGYWSAAQQTPAPPLPEPDPWPATAYWAAPKPATPPAPTWTRTYELPSARAVVSAGLQLALASTKSIRQASIYIGLLSLGAFGPAVILLLIGIGRLMSDPATADTLRGPDPTLIFFEQPDLLGPLSLIYIVGIVGLMLLVAISVDAQGIAIALLGGSAAERPLRLREAIVRARQSFWRLAGAGSLVGLASAAITILISLPFLRPFDSNEGVTFIASMIGTLAVTPFIFSAAGIVLGDATAMDSLRRSVTLFRARPRVALVVTLFTLVTAAIQTFALGAGVDVAFRVAEFLRLGFDQGGVAMLFPSVIVLAFIVAFGSLTFTIAAIVAAPQVAGFLGLTFYSAGLDRARAPDGSPAPPVRWVTLPMVASMAGLALVATLSLPGITSFQPRAASPLLAILRDAAEPEGDFLSPFGEPLAVEDAAGDQGAGASPTGDILAADMAQLQHVPDWLLDDLFDCAAVMVACGDGQVGEDRPWAEGAYMFAQRVAAAPVAAHGTTRSEWGAALELVGFEDELPTDTTEYPGANHRITTELDGEDMSVQLWVYEDGGWVESVTASRSAWRGDVLLTIVPWSDVTSQPFGWDTYARVHDAATPAEDSIREAASELREIFFVPWIDIYGDDFFQD